jgi:hypothetical protein
MKTKTTWREQENNSWQSQKKRWVKEKELRYGEEISQLKWERNFWRTMTFIFICLFIVALCI